MTFVRARQRWVAAVPDGHITIYPTKPMTVAEFDQLVATLGWKNTGAKT